jgi:hypothetical protein
MSAAHTRPAISDAIVPGEKPLWFSQRSCGVHGAACSPRKFTRNSAAFLMWSRYRAASVRPSCHASTIGSATSSSWRLPQCGVPSTVEFCGKEPSGFCCLRKR